MSADRREALLAGVLADPLSDEARLVYSDWLLEHDDPRGELIALQITLAGRLSPTRRREHEARCRELMRSHSKKWSALFPKQTRIQFRRGFVDRIEVDAAAFVGSGERLLSVEPIRTVELKETRVEILQRLVESDLLSRIKGLTIRGAIGDAGLEVLVSSPRFANLENLNVAGNAITAGGAAALAQSPNAGGLTTLTLTNNEIGSPGLIALAESREVSNVEVLFLARCEIDDAAATRLAGARFERLRKLGLGSNTQISDAGVIALLESKTLSALERVELQNLDLSREVRKRISERGWAQ